MCHFPHYGGFAIAGQSWTPFLLFNLLYPMENTINLELFVNQLGIGESLFIWPWRFGFSPASDLFDLFGSGGDRFAANSSIKFATEYLPRLLARRDSEKAAFP
jgi:hypothetical protein